MAESWQAKQRRLLAEALSNANEAQLRHALDGTIGDTQAFCWAALRQFDCRDEAPDRRTPQDFGLRHADLHLLLIVAEETAAHVVMLEKLLTALDEPHSLLPDLVLRDRLREARNLLAEHRDERVLYWRLEDTHTPHVVDVYSRLGVALPEGPIDSEVLGYAPPPEATPRDIARGLAEVGTVGGLLSLPKLHAAPEELEMALRGLAAVHQPGGEQVEDIGEARPTPASSAQTYRV